MDAAGITSNLAVAGVESDELSPSEQAHLEALVRTFLGNEYRVVRELLQGHRVLLDAMTEALLRDGLLDQRAMTDLVRRYGPTTRTDSDSAASSS
jgi:ATP-dependent Zn protease